MSDLYDVFIAHVDLAFSALLYLLRQTRDCPIMLTT